MKQLVETYRFKALMGSTVAILLAPLLWNCTQPTGADTEDRQDTEAKRLLQGTWVNEDDAADAFQVTGDTIRYFDQTSQPARFWIYQDSLYIQGAQLRTYHITKQAEHLLKFINVNDEEVKLTKSDQPTGHVAPAVPSYAMNLTNVSDTDTTTAIEGQPPVTVRIHTEPTSDRIIKSLYNELGLEVDNVYLDYAITVSLNGVQPYGHTFRKAEFAAFVPNDFLQSAILRSITFSHRDQQAIYLDASIGIPDAETCYVCQLRITPDGRLAKHLK